MRRCLRCESRFDTGGWRCPECRFAPDIIDGLPAFAAALGQPEIGFDASRFAALAQAEEAHFWFQSRTRLILWALRQHFPRARSFLEIGCGTGHFLAALAGEGRLPRLVGSEAHVRGLSLAAARLPGLELLQMDARSIPFREEFDVVGAFDVIEHIDEDEAVLAEMYAACRAGGGIVLTVPQHPWLWSYRDEFARHRRRYRRRDLLRRLAALGFERPWATSFVTLLLPLMAWSRLRQRVPEGFDASCELEVRPLANRLLGGLMAVERWFIEAGLSMPFGGSLLVVAHKPGRRA